MKSLDKMKIQNFPKFMYTLDGQNWYIDGGPVTLDEFIARDGFRKADKNKTKELDWEKVVFLFHNTYEGLAPKFGYETRKDTKAFDTKSQNGQLMIATCKAVVSHFLTRQRTELLEEIKKLKIKGTCWDWENGYNSALNNVIRLLNKKDE